ncbi:MAG: UbiA prenyltransferase family protein [Bacteroidia bacterium]|nr:UbiA prenyltransferase family protein [Bacteroidia bacterium]
MHVPHRIVSWIQLLRPHQYVKNVLIFSPMVFGRRWEIWFETLIGFVLFSLAASAVYALNDAWDAKADQAHPEKRFRPVAAGTISPASAYGAAFFLALLSLIGAFKLNTLFGGIISLYLANNLLYTFWLKRLALWDVFSIAAGFLLRVYGGGAIGAIPVSAYLFMSVFFLSLFLALGKRRYELLLQPSEESATRSRQSLRGYSVYYLDQLMNISATLTLVVYTIYLMQGQFTWLRGTLPVVVMGIFRYYHLTHNLRAGEPSRDLLVDPLLLLLGGVYGGLTFLEMAEVKVPFFSRLLP